jgi:hypothetical protein
MENRCEGEHRFFVADTIGVPAEGTVHVIEVCTACGEALLKSFTVAKPGTSLVLASDNKNGE